MKKLFPVIMLSLLCFSCIDEDPGLRQQDTRSYAIIDFNRLEVSDALVVDVRRGVSYSIEVQGDRRNLDDLQVYKNGNTLVVRFDNGRPRQYTTHLTITMPILTGFDFSGAVNARVSGFNLVDRMDISLSGATMAQLDQDITNLYFSLSGASQLRLSGSGEKIDGTIFGASILSGFEYTAVEARLMVTGASNGKVTVTQQLDVTATGASVVLYRGEPQVKVDLSGSSIVQKD